MSTARRPLCTGPRPAVEEQSRTDGRRTAAERAAGTEAPDNGLPRKTPTPARPDRRPLGTGPSTPADF
ncbi:MAG: hypothetical protein JO362_12975 [Streptomycetaceae bacterium]|nr:hypothetical protein [Streptomycetaceae bacterium]